MSPTRAAFPLSAKKIMKKTVKYAGLAILILFLFGGIVLPILASGGSKLSYIGMLVGLLSFGIIIIAIVVFVAVYFYQKRYFGKYFYDFTTECIMIRKGAVTQNEIAIPYEHIQDVFINQDFLDKLFGLQDVHFSSVTYSEVEPHIDGLTKESAEAMRAFIISAIDKKKAGEKVVPPVAPAVEEAPAVAAEAPVAVTEKPAVAPETPAAPPTASAK
jgi:membrane protein YdbS with pleckstrin-like domain